MSKVFVPGELLGLLEEGGCEAGEGDLLPPDWGGGGLPGEGSRWGWGSGRGGLVSVKLLAVRYPVVLPEKHKILRDKTMDVELF